ncbi:hypothetical protein GHK01_31780 [Sinorhizobium meliloti]|uniref:hypothetical protein n=1 Tax=Rhizobium meliloti TaxID=382 RepID=UPI001296973B|nr:hypothetical protein [Sinorhizobium meliloti]MQV31042.1 hypothetical protein [Sinorhizobium meliloti]
MGPTTLFDKSFIEMLNIDEAPLFDLLFSCVISPIFFVEVLADLEKGEPGTRTREKVVADVANKTPVAHSYPNVSHAALCLNELLGAPVEMREVPAVFGGRPVLHKGKLALVSEESAEAKAFGRWQQEKFEDVERDFAVSWRAQLKAFDNDALATLAKQQLMIEDSPKTLEQAFDIAKAVLNREGQNFLNLKLGYSFLGLEANMWRFVEDRWKELGRRPVTDHAPYFAHCLLVDIFVNVAMQKKLISPDRPSNRTDMAYLYYLPFAKLFVSNDKLHLRTAPLFLKPSQKLVRGSDLKADLKLLVEHYSSLPDDELEKGLFKVASRPPDNDKFLTTRLWRECGLDTSPPQPLKHDPALYQRISQDIKELSARASVIGTRPTRFRRKDLKDPDHHLIQRFVPRKWGRWTIIPQDVK